DEHGAIAFGPRQSATSLVSRRSQLRAARLDLAVLDQQIIDAQRETSHLKREIDRHQQALKQLLTTRKDLEQQSAAASAELNSLSQQLDQVARQKAAAQQALVEAAESSETLSAAVSAVNQELNTAQ